MQYTCEGIFRGLIGAASRILAASPISCYSAMLLLLLSDAIIVGTHLTKLESCAAALAKGLLALLMHHCRSFRRRARRR